MAFDSQRYECAVVHVEDGRIHIDAPFSMKDKCKSVMGARWNKARKAWTYPASPHSAKNIEAAFGDTAMWMPEATALLQDANRQAAAQSHKTSDAPAPIPITKTEPWKHQLQAYHYAANLGAVMLALDMGTGKTKIAVDLIANLPWKRVLILCPKSVVGVWPKEIEKHCGVENVEVLAPAHASVKKRVDALKLVSSMAMVNDSKYIAVVNYDCCHREPMADFIMQEKWDAVILDESHRIKAPGGKASIFCSRLGERVSRRICMTGTPLPHSPMDAYAQYRFLDKGIFGTNFTLFRNRYAIMGGYEGREICDYQNVDELHRKMYSIAYRVKAEDVQDLPDTVDIVREVELDPETKRYYEDMEDIFVIDLEGGEVTASNALTRLLRLQQITSGHIKDDEGRVHILGEEKQKALADLFEDLPTSEPVIVFCRFHRDLDAVATACRSAGRTFCELSGRVNNLGDFQDGKMDTLAVQVQSGGVGIDLTRAKYAVYYSLGYSLGDYEQSRKRIHRPGQKWPVKYIHLVARGTVDEDVYAALAARKAVIETVMTTLRENTL